jgi:glycosyltransferase involved in cell wall biosynthesis
MTSNRKLKKLNVCMIAYSEYDSDNRILRYAETLQKGGHQVDVIALSVQKTPGNHIINGVNVYGVQHRTRSQKSAISFLVPILVFFWRAMLCLIRLQIREKYDIVHVHSVPDFLVFTAWFPKIAGAKIILDIHDILPEFYASKFRCTERSLKFRLLLLVEKVSCSFADHVVISNDIWKDTLVRRAVAASKCTALINYPDRTIFVRRGKTRTDDGKFIVTYPGTLNWHQGLDLAIRAFAIIKDRMPEVEFHLYGSGPSRDSLVQLASDLGVERTVLFKGSRPIREIVGVIENSDLGVVPKRNDPFGDKAFSTKIMEFMSMGVPVVVSETTIDRYYFDSSMVKFFKPGDENSLAEALLEVMTNCSLREGLVTKANEFIEANDWEVNKHKYLEIIGKLVSERVESRERQHPTLAEDKLAEREDRLLEEYYKCRVGELRLSFCRTASSIPRFFKYGKLTCFGRYKSSNSFAGGAADWPDASSSTTRCIDGSVSVPFEPSEIVNNLRRERYSEESPRGRSRFDRAIVSSYYMIRPLLAVSVRKHLQKFRLEGWQGLGFPAWPVDHTVDSLCEELLLQCMRSQGIEKVPFIWFWPEGAPSCAIMTHDVETSAGRDFSDAVMDMDDAHGIKASFQIVPEARYDVSTSYVEGIWRRGFEVAVQDLNHDGRLFNDRQRFRERSEKINRYGREYRASGFRAAVLYRNQDWYDDLDFEYDMTVPSVAHLDPQRGGCCTVMPYFIGDKVELPVTMTQDYSLFHILKDRSLDLWNCQMDLVMRHHGLISYIIHPDYVIKERERKVFEALLARLADLRSERGLWIALPKDVARWWKQRNAMRILGTGSDMHIEGEGSDRARIAYASERDGRVVVDVQAAQAVASS